MRKPRVITRTRGSRDHQTEFVILRVLMGRKLLCNSRFFVRFRCSIWDSCLMSVVKAESRPTVVGKSLTPSPTYRLPQSMTRWILIKITPIPTAKLQWDPSWLVYTCLSERSWKY